MLKPLLANQSVELIFEDVSHLPRIYSDEGKVSQILRNFISNALKFTEKGEIRMLCFAWRGPDKVRFSVSDTGIGIAPQNLDLIFEDFSQLDSPVQRRVKGTGLGLPLSKKLAALLQGEVMVTSQLGVFSQFCLQIPVQLSCMRGWRGRCAHESSLYPPDTDESLAQLLVVEDRPEIMTSYHAYLRGSGFQVIPATTTHAAEGRSESAETGW